MTFTASIKTDEDFGKIDKLFSIEGKKLKRSSYEIKEVRGKAEFHIQSEDIAALRAVLNSITQTLAVYKKMEALNG